MDGIGVGGTRLVAAHEASALNWRRALVAVLAGLLLASCGKRDSAAPMRVVSLSPSTTETVFALGAGDRLVGRSQHCDHPAEVVRLPSVGGYADPDVERILALAPSLVVGERGPAGPGLEAKLVGHGVTTLFPPTDTVAQVGAMMAAIGERLDRRAEADRLRRAIDARMATVVEWSRGRVSPTVVLVFDARPIVVAGPGGFPDELLRLAGATNAVRGGGAYPTIDVERLLSLDPDVIIDASSMHEGPSQLGELEGWSRLRAVREGRVRSLASPAAMRPGPRLGEGLAAVARAVHGEAPPSEDKSP